MEPRSKASNDEDRIDIDNPEHIERWTREFAVDEQQLLNAVKAVGPRVEDVREHLELHLHRE